MHLQSAALSAPVTSNEAGPAQDVGLFAENAVLTSGQGQNTARRAAIVRRSFQQRLLR